MQGWIAVHRILLEKPIWLQSTPEQKVVLMTILLLADHEGNEWEWKGEKYKTNPGQFISSLESIKNRSGKGISIQNVRSSLKRFEKLGFLTNESTNKNRLVTVVNWKSYQPKKDKPTGKSTSNQQATNKQPTTNNNVIMEECKEKDIYRAFDHLSITVEKYERLKEKHPGKDIDGVLDKIENFAGNKKYKNLYLTANTWLKKEKVISEVKPFDKSKGGGIPGVKVDYEKKARIMKLREENQ